MSSPQKYVILLRGVNVGGHHRVPRAEFHAVLEHLGFRDVTVYINSGNAVLSSDTPPIPRNVQRALEDHFGFEIPTLILSGDKIQKIAAAIPKKWTNDPPRPDKSGYKSDVLYLFDAINSPDILAKIGYKPDIETMRYIDGAVITTISRHNQAKGSLKKIIGTTLYAAMTVRNINTARMLADLVRK